MENGGERYAALDKFQFFKTPVSRKFEDAIVSRKSFVSMWVAVMNGKYIINTVP